MLLATRVISQEYEYRQRDAFTPSSDLLVLRIEPELKLCNRGEEAEFG